MPQKFIVMIEKKKILVIAPHADDEVLGCGGYLLHQAENGADISIVIGTIGGADNYRTKQQEMEDTLFLRQSFGEVIKIKEDTMLAKRKHEFQRSLSLPF